MCMPPIPRKGISATAKMTMPTPLMPLSTARQNKTDFGCASTLLKMVEPVVVRPDVASNKASA